MAAPTFSVVAHVVSENGAAPTGSYTWQINYQSWLDNTFFPGGARATPQQSSTGTASCAPLVIGTSERDFLYGYTSTYAGQFNPLGVYTDLILCHLWLKKVGGSPAAGTVTTIAGTITVDGNAYPFTGSHYWQPFGTAAQLLIFWADPTTHRPVPAGTTGAVGRAETGEQHMLAMRDQVKALVGPTSPVPLCTQFVIATTFDAGYDFNLDTYSRGFEALRHMGFNTPILINKPTDKYSNQTTEHRARQIAAGLPSWYAINLARPPGNGFEWKDIGPPTPGGDIAVGSPTASGYLAWAQEVLDRNNAAGFAPADLKFLVGYDEPAWFYPFEVDLANNGTNTVEAPLDPYTEVATSAVAKARFQEYLQTLLDPNGNPYAPSDFGLSAWANASLVGVEKQAGTLHERRLFAATVRFLPWHFAHLFGTRGLPALATKFGLPIKGGFDMNNFSGRSFSRGQTPLGRNWSLQHPTNTMALGAPDWLYCGREGCTFCASDGWFSDHYAWTWSYRSSIFRMYSEPSNLLIPMYSDRLDGMSQQTLACVAHGCKTVQVYQMSPEYNRPNETMTERAFVPSNGNVTGLANAFRMMAQTEDLSGPGLPLTGRKVAILFSRPSQAFDAFGGVEIIDSLNGDVYSQNTDWHMDQVGTFECCAAHMNVPVDWLDDEDVMAGKLSTYSVLYVSGPNLSARARNLIEAWVNAGGKLVTSVGAGRYDWDNEPHAAPLCNLGGLTQAVRARKSIENIFTITASGGGNIDATRYVEIVSTADSSVKSRTMGYVTNATDMRATVTGASSGDVVARFANDDAPAVVDVAVGSNGGRHISFLFPMGMSYIGLGNAPSSFENPVFPGVFPAGHRDFLVTRPLSYTTYKRPVEVDVPMMECPVLTSSAGWAIVVLNWTSTSGTRSFRIRPPFAPVGNTVTKPDGTTIALTATGDGYTFAMPIDATGTILRVYATAAGPDTTPPTVTINKAATQSDPATAGPINFTVVFSEPVADFTAADITLSGTAGATTQSVTGFGTTYNVAVTGMTGAGTVIASLAAGVAHDAAGNASLASTSTDNNVQYSPTTGGGGGGGSTAWVTGFTPGVVRNDPIAWVGMRLTTGAAPVTVTSLGRWVVAGSAATHTVKLVLASTGVDVAGGSVAVNTTGAVGDAFKYVDLASPITLSPNTVYLLVSSEPGSPEQWLDATTDLATTAVAVNTGTAYNVSPSGGTWVQGGSVGLAYVPLSFRYTAAAGDVTPPSVASRVVSGVTLTITYDEPLDLAFVPAAAAFTVRVNGVTRTVTSVSTANTGAGGVGVVTLTLASPVAAGQAVTLSYVP